MTNGSGGNGRTGKKRATKAMTKKTPTGRAAKTLTANLRREAAGSGLDATPATAKSDASG
jgi:hypothetical protein